MKLSIAMTTYNGSKYILQQLESIMAQERKADEVIICDDCSADDTVVIIQNFIEVNNLQGWTCIRNEKNLGFIKNFYKAISMTSGDYIFLCDQDDVWHADKIKKSMRVMLQTGAAAICTASDLIDGEGNAIPNNTYIISTFLARMSDTLQQITFDHLILENIAQGCTYCFTKEVKEHYLRLNSQNLIHDYQILFVASLLGRVYAYNESTIDYRLHGNNAAGVQKNDSNIRVEWKKPKRKPQMVLFLKDLEKSDLNTTRRILLYKILYYLRIPYFIAISRQRRLNSKF